MKTDKQLLNEANDILRSFREIIICKGQDTNWAEISNKIGIALNDYYEVQKAKQRRPMQVAIRYFFRLLGLPFFIALSLIGAFRGWLRYVKDYVLYGGEAANYNRRCNMFSLMDAFDVLQEMQTREDYKNKTL